MPTELRHKNFLAIFWYQPFLGTCLFWALPFFTKKLFFLKWDTNYSTT